MGRDITKLHPRLQDKIAEFKEKCDKAGLKIGISECFRTVEEQDALYAIGRTKPGKIVTNARGSSYSSMHQWGVAFDFYRNDGKGVYNTSGNFFQKVGAIGKSIGLEWGGDWKSFKDLPHFQLKDWGSTSSTLKTKFYTPSNFIATWTNPPKDITSKGETKYVVNVKTSLRLRNKPSATSKVIVKMPPEAVFVVTGEEQNGFLKGTFGKKMGWASKK
jgi:peptidoglycan L-alanyl-D-glutamate endopeptidase CwlK